MGFSATDAALEGFRITRARPSAILAWAAVQLVFVVLARLALIWIVGDKASAFFSLTLFSNPAEMTALAPVIAQYTAAYLALLVILCGVLYPAVDRAVLRPEEGRWGWLRLGMDEARQVGVFACWVLVLLAVYLAGMVVVQILALLLGLVLGAAGAIVATAIGFLADLAFVIWIGVRLSLAPPATFDRRRFVLLDTWALTRGRVGPLLGAYAISWALSFLVTVLVSFIGGAIASFLPGAPALGATQPVIGTTFASVLEPQSIVEFLFSALAGGLVTPLMLAPPAYAYRALAGAGPARVVA
jgi:hypothetical protein